MSKPYPQYQVFGLRNNQVQRVAKYPKLESAIKRAGKLALGEVRDIANKTVWYVGMSL